MDTLAHAVSGVFLCSKTGLPGGVTGPVDALGQRKFLDMTFWAAVAFGSLPDLLSFGILFVHRLINGDGLPRSKPALADIPAYVFTNYNLTHSLVISAIVLLVLWRFCRSLLLPSFAWPLHILCDIPMHSQHYFPTPFLYPLSSFSFNGWSFGEHHGILYGYWVVIFVLLAVVAVMRSRGRKKLLQDDHSRAMLSSNNDQSS